MPATTSHPRVWTPAAHRYTRALSLASLLALTMTPSAWAVEIVVDNTAASTSAIGQWKNQGGRDVFGVDSSNSTKADATFTFELAVPESGLYDVYMWWPSSHKNASLVPVVIEHAAGTEQTSVDQSNGGGAWQRLGSWDFVNVGRITVASTGNGAASADAVKLVALFEPTPPPPVDTTATDTTATDTTATDTTATDTTATDTTATDTTATDTTATDTTATDTTATDTTATDTTATDTTATDTTATDTTATDTTATDTTATDTTAADTTTPALGSALLTWQAPTTNSDGSPLSDLAGYVVYVSSESGHYTMNDIVARVPASTANGGTAETYEVTALAEGTYYVVITAYNNAGTESSWSTEVTKTIGPN